MTRIVLALLATLCVPVASFGQAVPVFPFQQPPGVKIDVEGHIGSREQDKTDDLAAQRLRAKALAQATAKGAQPPQVAPAITYVSLKKLLAEARRLIDAKQELPEGVRYLGGMTQVRYVFVYDDDLVIAGPAEPIDAKKPMWATGKLTGRPVLQLEDFVVAMRYVATAPGGARQPFGCAIDPPNDAVERANRVMKEQANATRGARMKALKEAIGVQTIRTFGAQPDTRFEWVTVAADYLMKRMTMGLEPIPVPGVGSAVDNTREAANRFWFEAEYAPLLVSADADAFELRGPRVVLKAGKLAFDTKGATETAKTFAKNFSARMNQLATVVPLYAELQNVTDLAVVAALIRKDALDRKSGSDFAWVLEEGRYPVTKMPTPRTAETVVNYTNGSLVAGGVVLVPAGVISEENRERDAKGALVGLRVKPDGDNWYKTGEIAKSTVK